jgi:AcrR family transcriptional regulator
MIGMVGDAEATRRRLLDAATDEFAKYGIAGARVDRIAAAARSNKAQIYHYFTNKDGLFEAVVRDLVTKTVHEAPLDATNLVEYAGRLFDGFADNPTLARIANWYRLEGGDYASIDDVAVSEQAKIAAITKAQQDGVVPTRFTPAELLALVVHLAGVWHSMSPELAKHVETIPRERRRQVVVDSVAALLRD